MGDLLAKEIHKDPLVCRGLLLVVFKERYGDFEISQLTVTKIKDVIEENLLKKLEIINTPNPRMITHNLLKELYANQSLITFINV